MRPLICGWTGYRRSGVGFSSRSRSRVGGRVQRGARGVEGWTVRSRRACVVLRQGSSWSCLVRVAIQLSSQHKKKNKQNEKKNSGGGDGGVTREDLGRG